MQTFEEQKSFFDSHWGTMKEAVESGGGKAVVDFILGFEDDLERRVLFVFARQGLVMADWEGKGFDPYIEVCDAGVEEMLRQAENAPDDDDAKKRVNGAHVISYNLACDLADCWPGDDAPRNPEQFERGLQAAEDCLRWCAPQITAGFARDYWVKGMHELSLGDRRAAAESFEKGQAYAAEAAREEERPDTVSADGEFGVILASGFVGLARFLDGQESGRAQFDEAMEAFKAQLEVEERRDDAKFGIAQLETVRERYAS
ncbi:MAG: hypothetical protein ACYS99_05030 [Planctomycetota bacterium]|jgi:hypothetical protein